MASSNKIGWNWTDSVTEQLRARKNSNAVRWYVLALPTSCKGHYQGNPQTGLLHCHPLDPVDLLRVGRREDARCRFDFASVRGNFIVLNLPVLAVGLVSNDFAKRFDCHRVLRVSHKLLHLLKGEHVCDVVNENNRGFVVVERS